jgi:hypothetical protein
MQEIDVARAKKTVTSSLGFEDEPIEIKAGWEGTIVSLTAPEDPVAGIEFTEYRDVPILVGLLLNSAMCALTPRTSRIKEAV